MPLRPDLRRLTSWRRLGMLLIAVLVLAAGAFLLVQRWQSPTPLPLGQDRPQVLAQASAMPAQGWAPLRVYLSAFGSHAQAGEIVRYEWDLDGDGRFETDATSQAGYADHLYTEPGNYRVALRTTDSQGQQATGQLVVQVRYPGSSSVDYWTVFDDSRVRRIDIRLDQAEWDRLWDEPATKYQAKAQAVIFGQPLYDVGLRMSGQPTKEQPEAKVSWMIDTGAFAASQTYFNMHQLFLFNNLDDPSLLEAKLAYEMMAFAGLPASHATFAEVWIDLNGDSDPPEYWGVYTLVEQVDRAFLANRFGPDSAGGNLYQADQEQRGPMNLAYYGERIEDYPARNGLYAYGKVNNEAAADYSDIIALARVVDVTEYASQADFTQALESVFNVDAFLRYQAVVTILNDRNAYPATGDNYYVFNDPASGKFQWIPWNPGWGENPDAPLFSRPGGEPVRRAPLFERVFAVEGYRSRYMAYVDLLLREGFTPDLISRKAERYHQLLTPFVIQLTGDKAFFGEQAVYRKAAFDESWQELVRFGAQRRLTLLDTLQAEATGSPGP